MFGIEVEIENEDIIDVEKSARVALNTCVEERAARAATPKTMYGLVSNRRYNEAARSRAKRMAELRLLVVELEKRMIDEADAFAESVQPKAKVRANVKAKAKTQAKTNA